MLKRIWCFIWGHDWRTISVKEARARAGAYAVISLSECRRCLAMTERSKLIEPLEALKDSQN